MNSIRAKITAITIIVILTTVIAVFAVADFTVQDEYDRESVEVMNLIGQNTKQSLEKYFESIELSVEMTAALADDLLDPVILVECGAAGTNTVKYGQSQKQIQKLDAYLSDYCSKVEETFASVAGRTQGIITYYYVISPEVSKNVHGFFLSRAGRAGFRREEPINASNLDPLDMGYNTWYYTPIQRARPSWVGPYKASFMGEMWICSYLMPIYKAGKFIGVLGMDIPVETLASEISPIRVYQTGFASLHDADGRVIYHPDKEIGDIPDLKGFSLDEELLNQNNSGDDLIRYYVGNQKRQMSFCTLENGMKLIITAPSSEINAAWYRMITYILIITAVIIAVSLIVIMMFISMLTRPLQVLTAASRRLANSDYDVELDYKGKDEVGVLTGSFKQMRDRLKLYIEDLNRRIITDDLTDLPNMRYFMSLTDSKLEKIIEDGGKPVMIFFNLIGLKHYNRQYGFEEGDRLICEIADILGSEFGYDNASRFNQDHFAVIAEEEGLEEKLNKVLAECEGANEGRALPVRAGIYRYGIDSVDAGTAFDRAKYACERHRDSYISGFYYFDESMLAQVENVRYIINNLDRALEERWIKVYYQPIVRSENGIKCDVEALSRWVDPEKGMMPPFQFIPVLENARLIYRLDLYVLDRILEKMKMEAEEGSEVVPHSLNLSRVDFDSCDIVEEVRRRVDDSGIPRDRLTIEVTESMVGDDFEFMKSQILRFQELGFKVWMDDFGSGYSTLEVLSDIRFDLVKIDMRYMQRFDEGEESRIMLIEMIHMASELGLETVCEGVETPEQVKFLKEIGCTKLQGYYFGRPAPYEPYEQRTEK